MKKPLTFKTKLWLYFVIFAAIVFSVLWLLQTVFLQSFYNMMLIRNTNSAAVRIAETAGSEGITKSIDEIALENSLLIYITDTQGNLLYASDEYKNAYNRKHGDDMGRRGFDNKARGTESNVSKVIKEKKDNDKRNGDYRSLPDDYDAFLDGLKASPDGTFEYSDDSVYVYGTYIDYYGSEGKSVL
ncbi:MAG: hypothetical protein IIY88_07735, partial [Eubacterium sp.]|nr:hypothetical protein [Eubacterium sp.]